MGDWSEGVDPTENGSEPDPDKPESITVEEAQVAVIEQGGVLGG